MNEDNKWSINYSWTQPYSNWSHPTNSITKEMAVIEAIDNIITHMVGYPDAELLLKNIFLVDK
jgi:hypothetical protein